MVSQWEFTLSGLDFCLVLPVWGSVPSFSVPDFGLWSLNSGTQVLGSRCWQEPGACGFEVGARAVGYGRLSEGIRGRDLMPVSREFVFWFTGGRRFSLWDLLERFITHCKERESELLSLWPRVTLSIWKQLQSGLGQSCSVSDRELH